MTETNQQHEMMIRRHRPALVRFASISKVPPERMSFVIAHRDSRLGRATRQSGTITTERASFVIPITVDDIPKFAEVIGAPEVERLREVHGAIPVLVIDADDHPVVVWERLLPPQRAPIQNRSTIPSGVQDRG